MLFYPLFAFIYKEGSCQLTQFICCHHQNNLGCAILVGNATVRISVKCAFKAMWRLLVNLLTTIMVSMAQSRVTCVQGVSIIIFYDFKYTTKKHFSKFHPCWFVLAHFSILIHFQQTIHLA